MVGVNGSGIDVGRLRQLYARNPAAKAAFEYFAQRQNNSRQTTVERLQEALEQAGYVSSRTEIVEVFRALDEAGCGTFVIGRRKKPTRLEWTVGLTEVGRSAKGEAVSVEPIDTAETGEEGDEEDEEEESGVADGMREHRYWLRSDREVRLVLPKDLAPGEAGRLADFIRTLPIT